MQVDRVVRSLIDHSGMSLRGVSLRLGHVDSWARQTAAPGRVPKLDTVADVADLVGVDVVLVDRATGERVATVDPPRRADRADAADAGPTG